MSRVSCRSANGASEEQVQAAIDAANELIGTDVVLKMGGNVVATLDGSTFVQWMTFDENLTPTLTTEPLTAWVHELAVSKLDTIGCERTYTRPDGKSVTVSGGTYGWNSNEAELVKLLQDAVANKQVGEVDVPTLQNAATWTAKGERDWGAYCDIDLTEQHVRYYDAAGTLVWESGCVTGNPNEGDATPTACTSSTPSAKTRRSSALTRTRTASPTISRPWRTGCPLWATRSACTTRRGSPRPTSPIRRRIPGREVTAASTCPWTRRRSSTT